MLAVRLGKVRPGWLLATALSISMLPQAGSAYTPEQQQACSDDAFRLCGPEIPDVDRVTACMVRHKSELSPGCRVYFRPDPVPESGATPVSVGKPLSIGPARAKKPVSAKSHRPKKPAKPGDT